MEVVNRSSLDLGFVPADMIEIMDCIRHAGFDVWLVGGAIRDFLRGVEPKDWDLATNAPPRDIMRLFPHVIPVGLRHGTVQIHTEQRDVEVTSFQKPGIEGILEDLKRRDFTVNALALSYPGGELLDPFAGRKDLRFKILRAVENACARFKDDPLRTVRAGRFVSLYGFGIDRQTFHAMKAESHGLDRVAQERIREEMLKLLPGERVVQAIELLRRSGVLSRILPEVLEGWRKRQSPHGERDIYTHALYTVHHSPPRVRVRLAALLHDIAKPRVRKRTHGAYSFEGHRLASAQLAAEVMMRWRMSQKEIREVTLLVENHLLADTREWSPPAARRILVRVGPYLLHDLLDLARADRLAHQKDRNSLRQIEALGTLVAEQIELRVPLRTEDLSINGDDVMKTLGLRPGPAVGEILRALHEMVLEDPKLDKRETLLTILHEHFTEKSARRSELPPASLMTD